MSKSLKRIYIIIFIVGAGLVFMGIGGIIYSRFLAPPYTPNNDEKLRMQLDSIQSENILLEQAISKFSSDKQRLQQQLDSIKRLPQKIREKYTQKTNEIDNKSVNGIVAGFEQLFSENSIK